MRITTEEVRRVAILARLALTSTEEDDLIKHFDKILAYMDMLNTLDTTTVEPTAHVVEMSEPLRNDCVTNQPNTEALLANAPAREDSFFKVPKILE